MNMNDNNVGGRRLLRGGRNFYTPINDCECEEKPKGDHPIVEQIKGALSSALKKLTRQSWKMSFQDGTWESRILFLLLAINLGNKDNMTEYEMKTLLLKGDSDI